MSDDPDTSPTSSDENLALDLSSLEGLNFGPDWSERTQSTISTGPDKGERREGRRREGSDRGSRPAGRDRRPPRENRAASDQRPARSPGDQGRDEGDRRPRHGGGPRSDRGGHDRGGDRGERRGRAPRDGKPGQHGGRGERPPAPFRPVIEVLIYPDDLAFKALCTAMRNNCRTYELFEIARLILEKPERHVFNLKPKEGDNGPQSFFVAVTDGMPFETEEAAISHALSQGLEQFVEVEEVEVDPPKGSFPVIHKCGITGELIGPPNYHRYQALLQEHHATRCSGVPFARFQSKLESLKDEEAAQQWAEKMSKQKRYKLKEPEEDAPEFFDNAESVRFWLTTRRKAKLVRETDQVRISGRALENMPDGVLRASVEAESDYQKRFPLITANNLRGRLRRLKFTIYKKGSKGVSYVCAVKRKFRDGHKQFSESIQELLDFLDAHPFMHVGDLPEQFLGITPPAKATPVKERAPELASVEPEEASKIVEVHEIKRAAKRQEANAAEEVEGASTDNEPTPPIQEATGPVESAPEPEEIPAPKLSSGPREINVNEQRLRSLMNSLRWLVTEGYVTEFGDGRLFANPPMEVSEQADAGDAPAKAEVSTTSAEETDELTSHTSSGSEELPTSPDSEGPVTDATPEAADKTPTEEVAPVVEAAETARAEAPPVAESADAVEEAPEGQASDVEVATNQSSEAAKATEPEAVTLEPRAE